MDTIQYKLSAFEGPMDQLLHLIGQRKVSIHDVSIVALIEQYLEIMATLRQANLEIEAEFLEMAARLVWIKSAALLPKHKEEADPAEELRQELLDYRDCQYLAGQLEQRAKGFGFLSRTPEDIPPDFSYEHSHTPRALLESYLAAIGKGKRRLPPPVEAFSGIVAHAIVSVVSRYGFLFERLGMQKHASMRSLLEQSDSRSELVATFLAVLMLMKAKRVKAYGSGEATILELETKEEVWREIEDQ